MEIKNTYLMWIGSEHYKTIEDWSIEATEQGVSKRLPSAAMGKALLQPGTVVFVAHDEGDMHECPVCTGAIECPECRKNAEAAGRERALADRLDEEAEGAENDKARKSAERRAKNARKRADRHEGFIAECEECLGTFEITAGTGGMVVFEDGEEWDYRRYVYHRNQPAKWTADDKGGIAVMKRCGHCGGFGRIPNGKVFGLFVPEAVEYIDGGDDEEKAKTMEEMGFSIIPSHVSMGEAARGCGKRRPGGVYVVTHVDTTSTAGARAVEALGLHEGEVEVSGNFVSFSSPIDITGTKRFRGLASWEMPEHVTDEAEMIAEAME